MVGDISPPHSEGLTVGRRCISGGVTPIGHRRIQFDFTVAGVRYRPTLPWIPHEANLRRAREHLARIKARIIAGTFIFHEEFPQYRSRKGCPIPISVRTCGDVFDDFLRHEAARVARGDLAPVTLAAHRQILEHVWRPAIGAMALLAVRYTQLVKIADGHRWTKKTYNNAISALRRAFDFGFADHPEHFNPARALRSARIGKKDRPPIDPFSIQDAETLIAAIHRDWGEAQGNYDEFRFFTGLRPSEQIALVVSDYDAVNGVLSVTKARVAGIDRDRTKIGEDRRVKLCRRARAVLERQLALREELVRRGRIQHDQLFFYADGRPIRRLYDVHRHWQQSLKTLAIRYRRPYTARHSSVSWNLMRGRNPLFVAKQHGHGLLTMLSVYAAWTEGSPEVDIAAIRRAMRAGAYAARGVPDRRSGFATRNANPGNMLTRAEKLKKPSRAPSSAHKRASDLAMDLPMANRRKEGIARWDRDLDWRSGRDSNPRPPA
jgi:integrase